MADDPTTPLAPGTKIATDEHPTKGHAQWVKMYVGDDNSFSPLLGDGIGLDVDAARSRSHAAYYASADGARVAFNSVTGFMVIPTGSGEHDLCAFQNPSGSGKDVILTLGEFAANQDTRFRRYGGAATISGLGAPRAAGNRGGGSATPAAKLYARGQYTPANANETATPANASNLRKVAFIKGYHQYITTLNAEAVLRPGQQLVWTIDNDANQSFMAMVYLEWHELDAAG